MKNEEKGREKKGKRRGEIGAKTEKNKEKKQNDYRLHQLTIPDSKCSCGCAVFLTTRTALCPGANCIVTMRSETGVTQSLRQAHHPGPRAMQQGMRDKHLPLHAQAHQTSEDYNVTPTTHTIMSFCNAAWRWCPSINRRTCGSRCNASISESVYS